MKGKHFPKLDKLGYPWWVDALPLFFWIDEEFKEWLLEEDMV